MEILVEDKVTYYTGTKVTGSVLKPTQSYLQQGLTP